MNNNLDFYKWFETIASKLMHREISFRKIFKYLDARPTPIIIGVGWLSKYLNIFLKEISLSFSFGAIVPNHL